MNYANIKATDIANGPGVRVSLFVSGCTHRCKGCFNEVAWDFGYGKPFDEQAMQEVLDLVNRPFVRGLTLLGGEPLEPQNLTTLLPLLRQLDKMKKDLWVFSGYTLEKLLTREGKEKEEIDEMLSLTDVLVDGPFVEEQKNLNLRFRGSENQRLIDVKRTKRAGGVVLWED